LSRAYVDSSCFAAILLAERGAAAIDARLAGFPQLVSSNLLEAELLAALTRERLAMPANLLRPVRWILPDRGLTAETTRVLSHGYLRGADAWHLACALYFAPDPASLVFLTLDARQREVAERLGFAV
jgi:hypothetical protein